MRRLSKKVIRKIKSIIAKTIPHNVSYRPKDVYENVQEYLHEDNRKKPAPAYKELYPSYTSVINIDEEFYSKCADYMDLPRQAAIPTAYIVEIPHGRLHTDTVFSVAIISRDNKLVGGVSYQMGKNKAKENSIFEQTFFITPKKYSGTAFHLLIGGSGDNNYFHWLFDALCRIHLLQKSGWFDRIDYFIVPGFELGYQKDTLRLLGIDDNKIIPGNVETHIVADSLVATNYVRYHSHVPAWACSFLKNNFPKVIEAGERVYPYVYVSRNDSDKRFVINENELVNFLAEYGFKKVELGNMTFQQQVNLFGSAKVIIGPHGAGWANLVFCEPGTTAIELFASEYIIPVYYDLANKAGVNYQYMACESDASAENVKQGMRLNLLVDLNQLKPMLETIMEKYSAESNSY
ncbi:glycosyltransferase family 61 protein [Rhodocytophaga rosea]|uniref:Glycosyltransferase family 61 protein n=1 Tax=Rhodocytophaga rosea TaxID=2704465 RepID=A0A6C0GJA3_9BACT|nr:glycosyltransferase family 61 protein [Rhodocytophaga rosea]QHT67884.1 glycosyltransferase family 61 protein [Rhodocytophaga rosea]